MSGYRDQKQCPHCMQSFDPLESHKCDGLQPGGVIRTTADQAVHHPQHYGGADNPYEAIKVIEAWDLDFALGNAVKYISRAGKKPGSDLLEDLKKARWYLDRAISNNEGK